MAKQKQRLVVFEGNGEVLIFPYDPVSKKAVGANEYFPKDTDRDLADYDVYYADNVMVESRCPHVDGDRTQALDSTGKTVHKMVM